MPSGDAVCVNAEVEINVLDNNIAVHLKPRSHCMQRHTSTQDTADAKLYAITITIVGHIYMTSMCVKWITELKPNNLLVNNNVNACFVEVAYISTMWHWRLLV